MDIPLSKKKQKKLGSSKKGPVKGLRNVILQPQEKYWPTLGKDEDCRLEDLLKILLPELKRESQSIPWSQLRKMGKEERLAAQKQARAESQAKNNNDLLKLVIMGVNAVTRNLEKDCLASILLDSNVEPLLIKHVLLMAQDKGIPVLIVPFLKKLTLDNIGFASAAMGLKINATDADNKFNTIHKEIVKFSRVTSQLQKELSQEDIDQVSPTIQVEKMCLEDDNSSTKPFKISTNVYKYRSSQKERVFVPPNSVKQENHEDSDNFIAFGKDDDSNKMKKLVAPKKKQRYIDFRTEEVKKSKKVNKESEGFISVCGKEETSPMTVKKHKNSTYIPLKVKRLQGNNNRAKATKAPKTKKKGSNKN